MNTNEIGTIIKERLKHLGVNQQTLADLAGVGLNTLVAIERGEGNPQLSTFREGMQFSDTHTVSRKDFEEFGRRIGLSARLVKRELDSFATEQPLAQELIRRSFLSEKLKRYYWQSYNYRRTTIS